MYVKQLVAKKPISKLQNRLRMKCLRAKNNNIANEINIPEHIMLTYCNSSNTNTNSESNCNWSSSVLRLPIGRRIVNIMYVFDQILNNKCQMHIQGMGCSFIDSKCVKEIRKGFNCSWIFKCEMCNIETTINSDMTDQNIISINKAVTSASLAVGIGYSQVQEFTACIDIPCMSEKSFIKNSNDIAKIIEESAWEEMRLAGLQEKQLALDRGDVDTDGIPMCPVVADGQWGKRSYKTKYDSLSGAATIIGFHTSKVLFVGIRNRYCVICERSNNLKQKRKEHECFMNWRKSSTSMEADGISEGFLRSIELHGLKFNRLIGDGDSNVTKRLKEIIPYGPTRLVEKIECRNHLLRNFSTKIAAVTKNTKFPVLLRQFISSNIIKFSTAIRKAIEYRKNCNAQEHEKLSGLINDINNSFYHILGQHDECETYFCNNKSRGENLVPVALKCGLMAELKNIARRLIDNATSLLLDVTNNICEQFNSVINKFIAGKRINFSQKNGYNTRVRAAIISFNSGGNFLRKIHKTITNKSPGIIGKKFLSYKSQKITNNRKRRQLFPTKKSKKNKKTGPDEFYGLAEPLKDNDILSNEELEIKKEQFILQLKLNIEEYQKLEASTRNQRNCQQWFNERRNRLTASNFGKVCKMRRTTSCKNTVHTLLYGTQFQNIKQLEYGKKFESEALIQASNILKKNIDSCGFFVDHEIPFLGASPDGVAVVH
ncbi:hypothetical protein QTP88_015606 [Uroleucon formosanum]